MRTQTILWIIIFLVIGTIIGYVLPHNNETSSFWNILTNQMQKNSDLDLKLGLQEAYDRLMARWHADVAFIWYGLRESKSVWWVIKEIQWNTITLQVTPVNALADPVLDTRTLNFGATTKIYRLEPKTHIEMKNDMDIFDKKMQENIKNMSGATRISPKSEDFFNAPNPMKKVSML